MKGEPQYTRCCLLSHRINGEMLTLGNDVYRAGQIISRLCDADWRSGDQRVPRGHFWGLDLWEDVVILVTDVACRVGFWGRRKARESVNIPNVFFIEKTNLTNLFVVNVGNQIKVV